MDICLHILLITTWVWKIHVQRVLKSLKWKTFEKSGYWPSLDWTMPKSSSEAIMSLLNLENTLAKLKSLKVLKSIAKFRVTSPKLNGPFFCSFDQSCIKVFLRIHCEKKQGRYGLRNTALCPCGPINFFIESATICKCLTGTSHHR